MQNRIHTVLVPAGAEYEAVKRGLGRVPTAPQLVAIPAGPEGLKRFLSGWEVPKPPGLLLMGLGGSLCADHQMGAAIALHKVWNAASGEAFACDAEMTAGVARQLGIATGVGVSCDHVITSAVEKRWLGDRYSADVVDMESAVLLEGLSVAVAILRVISDDCGGDLPDIGDAIAPDGSLRPVRMAIAFAKKPLAATRLIKGSLTGLKTLEQLAYRLFQP